MAVRESTVGRDSGVSVVVPLSKLRLSKTNRFGTVVSLVLASHVARLKLNAPSGTEILLELGKLGCRYSAGLTRRSPPRHVADREHDQRCDGGQRDPPVRCSRRRCRYLAGRATRRAGSSRRDVGETRGDAGPAEQRGHAAWQQAAEEAALLAQQVG